jgi:hypothetical protein
MKTFFSKYSCAKIGHPPTFHKMCKINYFTAIKLVKPAKLKGISFHIQNRHE